MAQTCKNKKNGMTISFDMEAVQMETSIRLLDDIPGRGPPSAPSLVEEARKKAGAARTHSLHAVAWRRAAGYKTARALQRDVVCRSLYIHSTCSDNHHLDRRNEQNERFPRSDHSQPFSSPPFCAALSVLDA